MAKKIEEIPWDIIIPEVVKAFTPFIQGITWYAFSKVDKRANALNNLIAIGEIVPAIDLGLPRGIVLAAMYDKTGDALKMLNQMVQALADLPDSMKKFVKDTVDKVIPDVPEIDIDIAERKPGESWFEYVERRIRETGFAPGGKGLA